MTETIQNGTPLLSVDGLVRHFDVSAPFLNRLFERLDRAYVKAVDGIGFEIGQGETFSLVGESGCGKSTVARLIVGLYQPTAGSIKYEGGEIGPVEAAQDRKRMQPRMQMIFQDPYASLNPRWRVADIVAEPILVRGFSKNKKEINERVGDLLHQGVRLVEQSPNMFKLGRVGHVAQLLLQAIVHDGHVIFPFYRCVWK